MTWPTESAHNRRVFATRRPIVLIIATAFIAGLASCQAHAAPAKSPQLPRGEVVDEESTRQIRAYTTDPSYLTEWVNYLPVSRRVPSPLQFLGYVVGTPNRLTPPDIIHAYFRALAEASPRVEVFSMGKSHGGREMIVVAIADAPLLRRLDDIKAAHRRLADPRTTDVAAARRLARSVPPIYWLTAGLHSPETGPPEMVMELAYRLAVSRQRHIREIRRGVVTLITPILEVDGRTRMVDWFYRHLTKVTDIEDAPPRMAPYWGDYTAHDNNRDGLQMSQPLTRNYVETFHDFKPVATLDLHESVPLLYVSSGTGPYNASIDPITITEWQWMSSYEVSQATKLGLRGVWSWGFYTGWYPGYLLWVANNHNAIGRFYETFGNSHPGTFERDLKESRFAQDRVNSRQWYRPWPPAKRLKWSLRDNTNYMQTAVLASLQLVAKHGETLLFNFWQKGHNAIDRGREQPPHGFVIPAAQRDRGNLRYLLWLLAGHRIEVHRADADLRVNAARGQQSQDAGKGDQGVMDIRAGDYIVRADQPYGNFARTLLQRQMFPKSARHTPYDDVAWSLDLMLGLDIHAIDDPSVLSAPMTRLEKVPELPGQVGSGTRWIVDHRGQTHLASLRFALPKAKVRALAEPWRGHPRGSLVIEGVDAAQVRAAAGKLGLDAVGLSSPPRVKTVEVDLPRIALFHTWRYTQDSGWARYALEQLGIPYTLINKDHLRRGGLNERFDVIVVPSQSRLRFADMVHGIDAKWGPLAYTKTPEYPSHGVIDSAEDITGGMGFAGLANLHGFIEAGGVLITLGSAGLLATEGGIVRSVRSRPSPGTPGSHLTAKVLRPEHPLVWGFSQITHVFRGNHPLFYVRDFWRGMTVMQYGTKTWLQAEREADKKADIPLSADHMGPSSAPAAAAAANAQTSAQTGGSAGQAAPAGPTGPGQPGADKGASKTPLVRSGIVKNKSALERSSALIDAPVGKGRVILFSWNPLHRYQNHHDFGFFTNALLFYNDFPDTPSRDEMRQRETPHYTVSTAAAAASP